MRKSSPLFSFVATLALALIASAQDAVTPADWTRLAGQCSNIVEPRAVVVRTPDAWESLWREHVGGRETPAPKADFAKEAVVAVFAGQQRSGGYSVTVDVLKDKSTGGVRVLYALKAPRPDSFRITMMSQPFAFVKIPKPSGTLVLLKAGTPAPGAAERAGAPRPELRALGTKLADLSKAADLPAGLFAGL